MPTTTIIGYPDTLQALPLAERRAITNALDTAANITNPAERQALLQAITGVVAARRREQLQRESNRRTERARRHLIGAHVPLALYQRCTQAAEDERVSLYRWVTSALEVACDRAEAQHILSPRWEPGCGDVEN